MRAGQHAGRLSCQLHHPFALGAEDLAGGRQLRAVSEALEEMEAWQRRPTEGRREALRDLLGRRREEQNEYRNIAWGAVRIINDWELLLFEYALRCLLDPPSEAGDWAYQTARHYAERYDSGHGTGLTPASAPLVQDVADFWMQEFDLTPEALAAPAKAK
jgi:hypothetical protein